MEIRVLKIAFFSAFVSAVSASSLFNSSEYNLGANLVANPEFQLTNVSSSAIFSVLLSSNMPGWSCQNTCQIYLVDRICKNYGRGCTVNYTRGVDLDSNSFFDNISQIISIQNQNQYLVTLKWVPPYQNPPMKKFKLEINQVAIIDITVNSYAETVFTNQALVNLTAGNSVLNLRMYNSTSDSSGAVIVSVSLQQLIPIPPAPTQAPTQAPTPPHTPSPSNMTNSSNISGNTTYPTNSTNSTFSANSTNSSTINAINTPQSASYNPSSIMPSNIQTNYTNSSTNQPSLLPTNESAVYFAQVFDSIIQNEASKLINSIPGNRIFLNQLTQFLNVFDRLNLYNYHNQTHTEYSQLFLSKIQQINKQKSSLCQLLFQIYENSSSICKTINSYYDHLSSSLNQKYNYTSSDFLTKNQNGVGFFANNLSFIYFQTPFSLLLGLACYLLFNLLFKHKVSIIFRKYSLLAVILFVFFQGNIEQFAFYLFSQLKCFLSINFAHKVANVCILLILFGIIVFSIGGLLWLKVHYKKLVKYFVQYYGLTMAALMYQSCQRMVFPLVLGCAHAFLLEDLTIRTVVLSLIQTVYLYLRVSSLRRVQVKEKLKIILCFAVSFLRILLILTFYWFSVTGFEAINLIHKDAILMYIGVWGVELISNLTSVIFQLLLKVKKLCGRKPKDSKIHHSNHKKILKYNKQLDQKYVIKNHKQKRLANSLTQSKHQQVNVCRSLFRANKLKPIQTQKNAKKLLQTIHIPKIKLVVIQKGEDPATHQKNILLTKFKLRKDSANQKTAKRRIKIV